MSGWRYNGDGTASFDTVNYGTLTVGAGNVFGAPISQITTINSNYHEYQVISKLGISANAVAPSVINSALSEFPTPFGESFAGPGYVTHEQISEGAIANFTAEAHVFGETIPLHLLEPGFVIREVIVIDGEYAIKSTGAGTGVLPEANEALSSEVWRFADTRLLRSVVSELGIGVLGAIAGSPDFFSSTAGRDLLSHVSDIAVHDLSGHFLGLASDEIINSSGFLIHEAVAGDALETSLRTIAESGGEITPELVRGLVSRFGEVIEEAPFAVSEDRLVREAIDQYRRETGNTIDYCFAAGTPITMADGSHKPIERVRVGDEVLAYDTDDASGAGALTARRVTHTFITPDRIILDFHGLRVTPGHVFLCGEGPWAGKHRMLIDILREDGSIVGADGVSRRAATNCPVDSEGDRFVELAYITRADETEHKTARIRAGTLLIEQTGEARSVLQCLEAEGYQLLEDGLVQKPGEAPGPLKFFGTPPKPEDYVLQRSGLTLAEIAGNTGYEPRPANPWGSALASGWTPDDNRSGEAERALFLAGTPTRNTAGETLH